MKINLKSCVLGIFSDMYNICRLWCHISARETLTQNITSFIALHFSWYYLLPVLVIFVCVYILFSRYASITLGEEGEDPISIASWFAMLFSAGMGIGLVFWTTAEPISHAFKLTLFIKRHHPQLMMQCSFHFPLGIHAWAVYGIVALVFAYFSFIKDILA